MTRWRITDQLRKRGPLAAHHSSSGAGSTGTATIDKVPDPAGQVLDQIWEAEWEKNLLDAAVGKVKLRVDPQQYQIFDFYVNKEWEAERVAKTFRVSVNQVYLAKHRVTQLIKKEVERLEKEMT